LNLRPTSDNAQFMWPVLQAQYLHRLKLLRQAQEKPGNSGH